MPPICLITDFGTEDYYTGSMKGAILDINPDAKIVDITHEIPKQDILTGSFVLAHAAETFPAESVFIAVIDPGVGTGRRCILLRTENEYNFIGPDNGLFTLVAEKYGVKEIRKIENTDLMRGDLSSTFHGRDIMAPVGAHLSTGINPSQVGPKIKEMDKIEIEDSQVTNGKITGIILQIDDFGNIVTNIPGKKIKQIAEIGDKLEVRVKGKEVNLPFCRTFGDVSKGENLIYVGSSNLAELAENQGNLAEEINAERKDGIDIRITHNE